MSWPPPSDRDRVHVGLRYVKRALNKRRQSIVDNERFIKGLNNPMAQWYHNRMYVTGRSITGVRMPLEVFEIKAAWRGMTPADFYKLEILSKPETRDRDGCPRL